MVMKGIWNLIFTTRGRVLSDNMTSTLNIKKFPYGNFISIMHWYCSEKWNLFISRELLQVQKYKKLLPARLLQYDNMQNTRIYFILYPNIKTTLPHNIWVQSRRLICTKQTEGMYTAVCGAHDLCQSSPDFEVEAGTNRGVNVICRNDQMLNGRSTL